ncbi:MAG: hypothetical protein M1318_02670 [Firmicutes bacterium]|nr:hypothetical protein [Bacillota bacterium]
MAKRGHRLKAGGLAVRSYIKAYQTGDLEVEEFTAYPPQTVSEAGDRIEFLTGIKRSPALIP